MPTPAPRVDLRSDTVTRPTAELRAVMAAAEVGDDGYGDDPAVNALEEAVAGLLGHEAAVFVPSGTMANLLALRVLAPPASEVLCEAEAHIVTYEQAGLAALGGVQTRTLTGRRGVLDAGEVAAMVRAADWWPTATAAVAVEDSHVRSGGCTWTVAQLAAVAAVSPALHLDGARLWNSCVAQGVDPAAKAALATTVSVCLSKGLAAPAGSLVATDTARAVEVRRLRKQVGGAMRQAGVLAAAGLHVVTHHRERLAEDHARARALAEAVGAPAPETNVVLLAVPDARAVVTAAAAQGILLNATEPHQVRLVTHLDVDDAGVARAADVLAGILG